MKRKRNWGLWLLILGLWTILGAGSAFAAGGAVLEVSKSSVKVNEEFEVTVTPEAGQEIRGIRIHQTMEEDENRDDWWFNWQGGEARPEWNDWLFEDGVFHDSQSLEPAGTYYLTAEITYDAWDEDWESEEDDQRIWQELDPVAITVTSDGQAGDFSFTVDKTTVPRGETIAISYGTSANADHYWTDIHRLVSGDPKDEDADFEWIDHLADVESGTGMLSTMNLEAGDYYILAKANGVGYETCDSTTGLLKITVTEPDLPASGVLVKLSKNEIQTGEEFEIAAYAPDAKWFEVFWDYQEGDHWRTDFWGESSFRETREEYWNSGSYEIVVRAWFEDGTYQEAEPVTMQVSAPNGVIRIARPDGIPSVLSPGEDLSFIFRRPENADWFEINIGYEDENYEYQELLSLNNHNRNDEIPVFIEGDQMREGMILEVRLHANGAGYDGAEVWGTIPVLAVSDDTAELTATKTEVLVNENFEVYVRPTGENDIQAVRFFDGDRWWYDWNGGEVRAGDWQLEEGYFRDGHSFNRGGAYTMVAQVTFDAWDGDGEDPRVWHTTNVLTVDVTSYGQVGNFTFSLNKTEVKRGEPVGVTYTESENAKWYGIDLEILRGEDPAEDDSWEWYDGGLANTEDLSATLSTLTLEPGTYRAWAGCNNVGYEGRESDNTIEFTVLEADVPEDGIMLNVTPAEMLSGDQFLIEGYAPGACWFEAFWNSEDDLGWYAEWHDGDSFRDSRQEYRNAGTYQLLVRAHLDENDYDNYIDKTVTIMVTSLGEIRIVWPEEMPSFLQAGEDLTFTLQKPEYAEEFEVRVEVEGEDNELFRQWSEDDSISVSVPAGSLAEGMVLRVNADAWGHGYDNAYEDIRIPVIGAADGSVSVTTVPADLSALPVNQDVRVRVEAEGMDLVQLFDGYGYWEEEEPDEDGGWERYINFGESGNYSLFARVSTDGGNTWKTSGAISVTAVSEGSVGVFDFSDTSDITVAQGDFVTVSFTESEHADHYWVDVEKEGEEDGWQDVENRCSGTNVTFATADLEPGTYVINGRAGAVGYENRESDSRIRLTVTEGSQEDAVELKVSKTETKTGEDVMFTISAPGADRIALFNDSEDECWGEWDEDVRSESRSWNESGRYRFFAKAWFGEEEVLSEAVWITVTAENGKVSLDGSQIPSYVEEGEDLIIRVPFPENAAAIGYRLGYDVGYDDEGGYVVLSDRRDDAEEDLELVVPAEKLPAAGRIIHVSLWAHAVNYEQNNKHIQIQVIPAEAADDEVIMSTNKSSYVAGEPIEVTVQYPEGCTLLEFFDGENTNTMDIDPEAGEWMYPADSDNPDFFPLFFNMAGNYTLYARVSKDDGNTWLVSNRVTVTVTSEGTAPEMDVSDIPKFVCAGNEIRVTLKTPEGAEGFTHQIWYNGDDAEFQDLSWYGAQGYSQDMQEVVIPAEYVRNGDSWSISWQTHVSGYDSSEGNCRIIVINHDLRKVAGKAATCEEAGAVEAWQCELCGKWYTDKTAATEIQEEDIVIPAAGHQWDAGIVTKAATTAAEGVKTYTCSVCGATRTEAIPKINGGESSTPTTPAAPSTPAKPAAPKNPEGDVSDPTSLAAADAAAAKVSDTGEPVASSFAAIQLQSKKQANASITLTWNKVKGASGYVIYGNISGKANKYTRLAKQAGNSLKVTKLANGAALKKGTFYKFYVTAYQTVNGQDKVIATSKAAHVATKGGKAKSKANNVKKVTVNKKKVTLAKKGKKFKLKAKTTLAFKTIKLKKRRKIKYESSDTKVATVSSKGVIKAVGKGSCYVYVYSQNGTFAKVTVKVKK